MNRLLTLLFLLASLTASAQKNIYGFSALNAKRQTVEMSAYRGRVVLVVNTATHCGFTPQYELLQQLYEKYHDQGLEILDFPCNQFGGQAPEAVGKISEFCTKNYHTQFTLFEKVLVNGPDATPLFVYLKRKLPFRGFDLQNPTGKMMDDMLRRTDAAYDKNNDVKWNFTKFLVNRRGKPVRRFEPTESADVLEAAIVKALKR